MKKSRRTEITLSTIFLSLLVILMQANIAMAQETSSTGSTIYLPVVISSANVLSVANEISDNQPVNINELIENLNEKYSSAGVNLFVLESATDGTLHPSGVNAANVDLSAISTFNQGNLLPIPTEAEFMKLLDSIVSSSQESHSNMPSELDDTSVLAAQLINSSATATWYEAYCGTGAYLSGTIFCWKNIGYTYQIDDVGRKVVNPNVVWSGLSGLQIALSWTHLTGSANVVNSKTVSLRANGTYLLGVSYAGLPIGLSWNGTWTRTVNPPCAICR